MASTYTPSQARAHLFEIIKQVNDQHEPVAITPARGGPSAVLIAADDWSSIAETLYLEATGTMAVVRQRKAEDSETINVADINWDAM